MSISISIRKSRNIFVGLKLGHCYYSLSILIREAKILQIIQFNERLTFLSTYWFRGNIKSHFCSASLRKTKEQNSKDPCKIQTFDAKLISVDQSPLPDVMIKNIYTTLIDYFASDSTSTRGAFFFDEHYSLGRFITKLKSIRIIFPFSKNYKIVASFTPVQLKFLWTLQFRAAYSPVKIRKPACNSIVLYCNSDHIRKLH